MYYYYYHYDDDKYHDYDNYDHFHCHWQDHDYLCYYNYGGVDDGGGCRPKDSTNAGGS